MYTVKQQKSITAFQNFVGSNEYTRKDIRRFIETGENKRLGVIHPWFLASSENRSSHGVYSFPTNVETTISPIPVVAEKDVVIPETAVNLMMVTDFDNMVPEKFKGFVPWGHYKDIRNIIKSNPNIYISQITYK